jgi:hypothetical protein
VEGHCWPAFVASDQSIKKSGQQALHEPAHSKTAKKGRKPPDQESTPRISTLLQPPTSDTLPKKSDYEITHTAPHTNRSTSPNGPYKMAANYTQADFQKFQKFMKFMKEQQQPPPGPTTTISSIQPSQGVGSDNATWNHHAA